MSPTKRRGKATVEGILESIRVWKRPAVGADLIPPSPHPVRSGAMTYVVEWTDTSGGRCEARAALDSTRAQHAPPGIGRQLMVVGLDPPVVVAFVILMADGEGGVRAEVCGHGLPRAYEIPIED